MTDLSGKVAVVSVVAGRIGFAIAERCRVGLFGLASWLGSSFVAVGRPRRQRPRPRHPRASEHPEREEEAMFRMRTKVDELVAIPALHGCRPKEIEFLATQTDEVHFERGQLLKAEGRPCNELLIVLEGDLLNGEGQLLSAGAVIGAEAMWERALEPTTVRAATDGRALTMGHSQLRAWKALAGRRTQRRWRPIPMLIPSQYAQPSGLAVQEPSSSGVNDAVQ